MPGSSLFHGLLTGRAHLNTRSAEEVDRGYGLDRESTLCLSCHDGGMASSAGVRVVTRPGALQRGIGLDLTNMHPVGVRYTQGVEMRSVRNLPPEVRLFAGRVGCGSCHSVYSGLEMMLSAEIRGSALCLTCHLK